MGEECSISCSTEGTWQELLDAGVATDMQDMVDFVARRIMQVMMIIIVLLLRMGILAMQQNEGMLA